MSLYCLSKQFFHALRRRRLLAVCAMLAPLTCGAESTNDRFAGSGTLSPGIQESVDSRYSIIAELQKGDTMLRGSAFELTARLSANVSDKSLAGTCAPLADVVFKNGFE